MVIEFFGLPGSGKTFLANKYIAVLRSEKNAAINLVDKSRTSFFYKVVFRYWLFIFSKSSLYKDLYGRLSKLLHAYKAVPARYNTVGIDSYVKRIAFYLTLYAKLKKRKKKFFFDEGVYQQIVNMIVNYNLSNEDALKVVNLVMECESRKIFIDISLEDSISSIKKRNRHICFIDELEGVSLVQFLEKYKQACIFLSRNDENVAILKRSWNFSEEKENLNKVLAK